MTTADLELEFKIPSHLYVPSPPLWIEANSFRGPLDLLLYLIRQQNFDILDIPMALIAAQYLEYLNLMQDLRFELAPDYLLMAVRLLEIKSLCLLPKVVESETCEPDPRAALVEQLYAYEQYQQIGSYLDSIPRWERELWPIRVSVPALPEPLPPVALSLASLQEAYQGLQQHQAVNTAYQLAPPKLELSTIMEHILTQLQPKHSKHFYQILPHKAPELEIVVSFQALLELAKDNQILLEQNAWQDLLWITLQPG